MRIFGAALSVALVASACAPTRDTETDNQITALRSEVERLKAEKIEADAVVAAEPPKPAYDLVVSWPNAGAPDHTPYADQATCEKARDIISADNQAKIDESQSHVGEILPGGARLIQAARPRVPTAYCLPV